VDLDPAELRVLGCLIEKQRTTPDTYPLSLNSLRLACNQATNRDPVVEYDEQTIRRALDGLSRRGWARLASGPGSRSVKYRHLFDEALRLDFMEVSLLAVLMLRGPQTLGELKQRTERLHRFESLEEVDRVLSALSERELVARLVRRPGQKEDRFEHLLGREEQPSQGFAADDEDPDDDRLGALEQAVIELRDQVGELRAQIASFRPHGTAGTPQP
jgi:uncharacterized protein YceH (UPF0502 family)